MPKNKTAEDHPLGPALGHPGQSCLVIAAVATFDNHDCNAARASRGEHCSRLVFVGKTKSGAREKSTPVACGTTVRRSSRLPASSPVNALMPVTLPPGRLRRATRPFVTG